LAVASILLRGNFWQTINFDRTCELSDTIWVGGNALKFGLAELIGGGTPLAGDLTSKLISYYIQAAKTKMTKTQL
jgi:hypothetical protein